MFEKNDGKGVNAIQNKFTAMLKTALHNHRIDYEAVKNSLKVLAERERKIIIFHIFEDIVMKFVFLLSPNKYT